MKKNNKIKLLIYPKCKYCLKLLIGDKFFVKNYDESSYHVSCLPLCDYLNCNRLLNSIEFNKYEDVHIRLMKIQHYSSFNSELKGYCLISAFICLVKIKGEFIHEKRKFFCKMLV